MKFSVLASSSSANCSVLLSGSTGILIDAGLSKSATFKRLAEVGIRPEQISCVCVSHSHLDHAGHAAAIGRALGIPVYMSEGTGAAMKADGCVLFQPGAGLQIGNVLVETFEVPHDAPEPVGFSFFADGFKISTVTDLGWIPPAVAEHLVGSDLLMIESNYSCAMLKCGPHPWKVKERVAGENGHLSNELVAEFIMENLDSRTSTLILSHLSAKSNHPALAESMAARALAEKGLNPKLLIAADKEPISVVEY